MKALLPSASDRIVDAYAAARAKIAARFPNMPPLERERTVTLEQVLHQHLCAAVEAAYDDGARAARATYRNPSHA